VQVLISDAVRKRIFDTAGAARVKVVAATLTARISARVRL
jgi:hypothetical protein